MQDKLKVMLTTEGTYPYHQGGVSTWCDILVKEIGDIDYILYSIIMNPFVTQKFSLPSNTSMLKLPLWGTEEPSEHLSTPFSLVYLSKKRTVRRVIKKQFIPLFKDLITEILSVEKNPLKFGNTLLYLYRYFQEYEYKKTFKSEITWEVYKKFVSDYANDNKNNMSQPDIFSLNQSLGWLYRFLNILNTPVPKSHVTHSTAAAFCGVPCILSKLEYNTPFLLTEHGLYIREQYLSLSKRQYSSFLSNFLISMIHSITSLNYYFADQVSPVCNYNTRWEHKLGVKPEVIQVIYNGVDKKLLTNYSRSGRNKYPTVVIVARIDPVKDIITLIKSAKIVKEELPDVRFIIYGSVSVPEYFEECTKLQKKLGLEKNFIFAGHTDDVSSAYASGDIVALSSITEGFPYSIVEAMIAGKPVVATDVGGIKEALNDSGIVVNPGSPEEMAKALLTLLNNNDLRINMGEQARERALNLFTLEKVIGQYYKSYIKLAVKYSGVRSVNRFNKQRLLVERGYAFMAVGYYDKAINQFYQAADIACKSPAVPIILTEIANAYNYLGKYDLAFNELEKAEMLVTLQKDKNR